VPGLHTQRESPLIGLCRWRETRLTGQFGDPGGRFPKALESFPAVKDGIPMSLMVWLFAWVGVTVGSTRRA
jgi:hypothetical protein